MYETKKVYNFEVADWHNYFISLLSILVHNVCEVVSKALKRLLTDPNRITHILQKQHKWDKLVPDGNCDEVYKLISKTMDEGAEATYKSVNKKVLQMGDEIIEVTYKKIDGEIFISDAWIK